ncbi:ABC transporter ATP-binding protein [Acidobacteriota bacterium]
MNEFIYNYRFFPLDQPYNNEEPEANPSQQAGVLTMWWIHDDPLEEDTARRIRLREMLPKILGLLKPYWKSVLVGVVLLLLSVVAEVVSPLVIRHLIDHDIKQGDLNGVFLSAALYCGLFAAGMLFAYLQIVVIAKIGLKAITVLKKDLLKHLLSLSLLFFDKNPPGRLMARVESDAEKLRLLFAEVGLALMRSAMLLGGSLAVMLATDVRATLVVLAIASPLCLGTFVFLRYMRKIYGKVRRLYARISSFLTEYLQGVPLVKAYGFVEEVKLRLALRNKDKLKLEVSAAFLEYGFWSLFLTMEMITVVAIIALGSSRISSLAMSLGTMVLFIEYTRRTFFPIIMFLEQLNFIQRAFASADRVFGLLDTPSSVPDREDAIAEIPERWEVIRFEGVTFSYDGKRNALDDVSFEIRRGKKVALVGLSGGGKTTVVNLLMRFYEPTSGRITVDGVDVREYRLRAWRGRIGLVLQDIHLFPGTMGDNLRVLNDDIPEERLDRAIRIVQAEETMNRLPEGYETTLAEGGQNLSMGQRQLISFARALVRDPHILILDEATSSVDPGTETMIRKSMERMLKGRTAIIVAHRLSTITASDRIFVLHKGRLAEEGSHDELYDRRGIYRDLFDLQFKSGEVA